MIQTAIDLVQSTAIIAVALAFIYHIRRLHK
jgi:hypothetical protein